MCQKKLLPFSQCTDHHVLIEPTYDKLIAMKLSIGIQH